MTKPTNKASIEAILKRVCWRREKLMDGSNTGAEIEKQMDNIIIPEATSAILSLVKSCVPKKHYEKPLMDFGSSMDYERGLDIGFNRCIDEMNAGIQRNFGIDKL